MASPDRDDCDQSRDLWRSYSPVKLEPLEAGGLWGPWCQCFVVLLLVVVLCAPASCTSLREKRNIRPLVSGPSTEKSKRGKDVILKSPEIRPLAVGLLGVLFFWLTYKGIVLASIGAHWPKTLIKRKAARDSHRRFSDHVIIKYYDNP
jgi:hypothetical protein